MEKIEKWVENLSTEPGIDNDWEQKDKRNKEHKRFIRELYDIELGIEVMKEKINELEKQISEREMEYEKEKNKFYNFINIKGNWTSEEIETAKNEFKKESKLLKFNQRAKKVDEDIANFSFGIIIKNTGNKSFSFDMVNDKGEVIKFINMNEWKIYSILSYNYFTREKISFDYSDPNGSKQKIETGGLTINIENNNGIDDIAFLLEMLFNHFRGITCFECIESVIDIKEYLENGNLNFDVESLNHLFMKTVDFNAIKFPLLKRLFESSSF